MELIDTYRHKGLRKQLLKELEANGISDERVLNAMDNVPRHYFMEGAFLEMAYENRAFQIGAGQTISQPYTVAFQSQILDVSPRMKVLEIGTGSGYQTSVLCEMGAKVYTIERQKFLFDQSKVIIKKLGYKPHMVYGDGYKGIPAFAPYDRILITCAAPEIPEALLGQLKVGGVMVIPYGEGAVQEMLRITKTAENQFEKVKCGRFSFVPMLSDREQRNL